MRPHNESGRNITKGTAERKWENKRKEKINKINSRAMGERQWRWAIREAQARLRCSGERREWIRSIHEQNLGERVV